jgi:hypothetical protein
MRGGFVDVNWRRHYVILNGQVVNRIRRFNSLVRTLDANNFNIPPPPAYPDTPGIWIFWYFAVYKFPIPESKIQFKFPHISGKLIRSNAPSPGSIICDCIKFSRFEFYPGSRGSLRGKRNERREGRASGHIAIGCKSHFHTWLGSEFESRMWLAICKNMSNRFGK